MDRDVLADRLWAKTAITQDGCWEWMGSRNTRGYGHVSWKRPAGESVRVHRIAFETFVERVPPKLELDHLCRNRACWNPDHLEVVTHAENMRRSRGFPRPLKDACKRGHEYTPENTYTRRSGTRMCRTCLRERDSQRMNGWERQRRAHEHARTADHVAVLSVD